MNIQKLLEADINTLNLYAKNNFEDYPLEDLKKHYLEISSGETLNGLGTLYYKNNDYENAKKYYIMGIEKGDSYAMNNLGALYFKNNDYENAKKYYLMAIEKGNSLSMNNLGILYYKNNDYENAKKYFIMGIQKGNRLSMNNLGILLRKNNEQVIIDYIVQYKKNNSLEKEINELKQKNNELEQELLEEKLRPGPGSLYLEAKTHFETCV